MTADLLARATTTTASSLPYHEPGIVTILTQSSLLLLLNVVNRALDKAIYCGLLGQVFLGVAWGTPGAHWLSADVEAVLVQLGYLGLLLIVYEGGLSTPLASLRANLALSAAVALTGIGLPIALSFAVLPRLLGAEQAVSSLQCFAAGAALCSTSLGTTFTVLASSGLVTSRLGVVLASAAMLDDVAGLVMVQVISNLGRGGDGGAAESVAAATIVRPILVSLAFAVAAVAACLWLVKPATAWLDGKRARSAKAPTPAGPVASLNSALQTPEAAFALHTLALLGCVAGAAYAGTSTLFAAYIAGAAISWWDTEVPHLTGSCGSQESQAATASSAAQGPADTAGKAGPESEGQAPSAANASPSHASQQPRSQDGTAVPAPEAGSGMDIYARYYQVPVDRVLRPFFFASIGFSIPITDMFSGPIVWKGIVYSILMAAGKMACGVWLLRLSTTSRRAIVPQKVRNGWHKLSFPRTPHFWLGQSGRQQPVSSSLPPVPLQESATLSVPPGEAPEEPAQAGPSTTAQSGQTATTRTAGASPHTQPPGSKPKSVYPALILGCGMTARGEIGFLVSSIAESKQIFAPSGTTSSSNNTSSDIFLVVTWAIVLCTIAGPIAVGLLVQRVRKLEKGVEKEGHVVRRDVLGVWGVH